MVKVLRVEPGDGLSYQAVFQYVRLPHGETQVMFSFGNATRVLQTFLFSKNGGDDFKYYASKMGRYKVPHYELLIGYFVLCYLFNETPWGLSEQDQNYMFPANWKEQLDLQLPVVAGVLA